MTDVIGRDGVGRLGYGPFGSKRLVAASHRFVGSLFQARSSTGLSYDPYDHEIRKDLAEHLFRRHRNIPPLGTAERGRLILDIIQETFPTERLARAYFENLDSLLDAKPVQRTPGQIVIGIGSGRNGSTSLAKILSTIEESCCTHENPPLMCWSTQPQEVRFHIERLKRLPRCVHGVGDAGYWVYHAIPW